MSRELWVPGCYQSSDWMRMRVGVTQNINLHVKDRTAWSRRKGSEILDSWDVSTFVEFAPETPIVACRGSDKTRLEAYSITKLTRHVNAFKQHLTVYNDVVVYVIWSNRSDQEYGFLTHINFMKNC